MMLISFFFLENDLTSFDKFKNFAMLFAYFPNIFQSKEKLMQ